MKRQNIGFLVFMLVVGFAAVSAVLVVNGNINISFNESDFTTNIIFTEASSNDGTSSISTDGQTINFETKKLSTVGDTAVLDFTVVNKSRQYDANVTIKCGLKDTFTSLNDYLDIKLDLTSPFELAAGTSKNGQLTIKLKKAYTENESLPELTCTLIGNPVSRESLGNVYKNKFSSSYVDSNLNGADPVLDGEELIPVKLANNGDVRIVEPDEAWYDYNNKEWANSVILVDEPSKVYQVNDIIEESDIESYFVWIPRYRYQIFDEGNYTSVINSTLPTESNTKEIQIEFESKDTATSNGTTVGSWLTHPAFTNYDTNGIWVGKFETGYAGATSKTGAEQNTIDASKVIIKPNVYSWRGITVSNIFKTALSYEKGLNSHMMRNTEWGATAYLSYSRYGIKGEIQPNNSSNYLTGYAADISITTKTHQYNTENGYLANTTGNISGIYDMSGGAWDYVAGYRANTPKNSEFTIEELTNEEYVKHFDAYNANSDRTTYNYRILGDATGEMGAFYQPRNFNLNNWYADYSIFVSNSNPWFARGGSQGNQTSGQFAFVGYTGGPADYYGFRITLVPKS